MEFLQSISFTRHGETYFVNRSEGIFLVPSPLVWTEYAEEIKRREEFRYEERKRAGVPGSDDGVDSVLSGCKKEAWYYLRRHAKSPDTFSLTTAPLNKAVLLSEKTTVVLRDVALSD
ncbi:MAG: uncharacterized protein A8A55_2597, partial [Amphiamblys sp. WSBS2006]